MCLSYTLGTLQYQQCVVKKKEAMISQDYSPESVWQNAMARCRVAVYIKQPHVPDTDTTGMRRVIDPQNAAGFECQFSWHSVTAGLWDMVADGSQVD